MVLANDYLVPVTISLMLMAIWFLGKTAAERDNYQRAVACAAISIGSACGLALATNHLYRHPHPFEDMPQLLERGPAHLLPHSRPRLPQQHIRHHLRRRHSHMAEKPQVGPHRLHPGHTDAPGQALRCSVLSFGHTGRGDPGDSDRLLHLQDRDACAPRTDQLGLLDIQKALRGLASQSQTQNGYHVANDLPCRELGFPSPLVREFDRDLDAPEALSGQPVEGLHANRVALRTETRRSPAISMPPACSTCIPPTNP